MADILYGALTDGAPAQTTDGLVIYRGGVWRSYTLAAVTALVGTPAAAAVAFTPTGSIAATDVQAALAEVATEYAAADSTHAALTVAHGATGAVVGTTTAQTLTNKSIGASQVNSGTLATARLGSGTADATTYLRGDQTWATPAGSGTSADHALWKRKAAMLDPGCLEPFYLGTSTYTVATNTKYMLASWAMTFSGLGADTGRIEIRDADMPFPMPVGTALKGRADVSGLGNMVVLDPGLVTIADGYTTYHDRMLAIEDLPLKVLSIESSGTGTNVAVPFLPGAYGAIVRRAMVFDWCWLSIRAAGSGWSLLTELNDSTAAPYRGSIELRLPVNTSVAQEFQAGFAKGTPTPEDVATLVYSLLPSTWSGVADPNTYNWRDDFAGASLDTATKWTRAQSTAGNVEITTQYQWCKLLGDGTWGNNGLYGKTGQLRSANRKLIVDLYTGVSDNNAVPNAIVGWSDGAGQSYTNFKHGLDFTVLTGTKRLYTFENGVSVNLGVGWTTGSVYRVRITLKAAGGATYEIQGGTEYPSVGAATWTTLASTSADTTATLYPGATISDAVTTYLGDMRVI